MRIAHTMYRVLDTNRSVDWYRQVFGWEVVRQTQLPDALNTFIGPDAQSDILELTVTRATEPYEVGEAYGHIAVEVPDLDALLERLERLEIRPERPPFIVREADRGCASSATPTAIASSSPSPSRRPRPRRQPVDRYKPVRC